MSVDSLRRSLLSKSWFLQHAHRAPTAQLDGYREWSSRCASAAVGLGPTATSDAAPKKSVWRGRRIKVITETVQHGEIAPEHICERDMAADSCTKYVKHEVWARHMHYVLNLPGDPPDCHQAGWIKVAPTKNKAKPKPKLGSKA